MEKQKYALNIKEQLCVGRCAYQFQPIKVENKIDETTQQRLEVVHEGCMYCASCGHTIDVYFEHEEKEKERNDES